MAGPEKIFRRKKRQFVSLDKPKAFTSKKTKFAKAREKLVAELGKGLLSGEPQREKLMDLILHNPIQLFKNIRYFKKKPWAEKLYTSLLSNLKNIGGDISDLAFKHIKDYSDAKWAGKLLILASKASTKDAFRYAKDYKNIRYNGKLVIETILPVAAKNNPYAAFIDFKYYSDLPETLVDKVLVTAAKENVHYVFAFLNEIKNWKYLKKLLILVAKKSPGYVFVKVLNFYNNEKWTKEILKTAIKTGKCYFYTNLTKKLLKLDYAEELLNLWIDSSKDMFSFFRDAELFKKMPGAEKIFIKVAKKDSEYVFQYIEQYKEMSWAFKVFKIAARNHPGSAIRNLDKYYLERFAPEIVNIAVNEVDNIRLKHFVTKEFSENVEKYVSYGKERQLLRSKSSEAVSLVKTLLKKPLKLKKTEKEREKTLSSFALDPALRGVLKIKSSWLSPPVLKTAFQIAQYKVIVARNLYFRSKKFDEKNVRVEYKRVLKERARYAKMPLFKGRNVVYLANNDIYEKSGIHKGKSIFGTKVAREEIKRQCGERNFSFIKGKNSIKDLLAAKKKTLELIEKKPNLTFVFDGHGGPRSISLSGGRLEGTVRGGIEITSINVVIIAEDLAKALIKRRKWYPNESPPILIFDACYNSNFIRKLYSLLGNKNLPITLGGSEYGQQGIGTLGDPYGSKFFSRVLEMGKIKTTTFRQVIENENNGDTNPTLIIPPKKGTKGKIRQIVKISKDKPKRPKV